MKNLILTITLVSLLISSCSSTKEIKNTPTKTPFVWEGANVYFLMTDRFLNGNPNNDNIIKRDKPTAKLRGFEGGDIRGVIQKLDEGYFSDLGITLREETQKELITRLIKKKEININILINILEKSSKSRESYKSWFRQFLGFPFTRE